MLYTMFLETVVFGYRLTCMLCALLYLVWTKTGLKSVTTKAIRLGHPSGYRKPRKIPNHLSLVLFEDKVSVRDVTNLIQWSFELGVSVLSVCDVQGQVVQQTSQFHQSLEQRGLLNEWKRNQRECYTYRFTFENDRRKRDLTVNYHSVMFGLDNLCDAARHVCRSEQCITDKELSDAVYQQSNLPDIELTIHFGTYSSLLGTLPWHSRWSEFLNVTTHWHIEKDDFLNLFSRFGDIEQRWGH